MIRSRQRLKFAAVGLVAVVVTALVVARTAADGGASVEVLIPAGATLPEVATILESHDVIRSARLFHVYTRARRADRKLKAGDYRLSTGSSMRSVLSRLTRGEVMTVALTVPEGLSIRDMAPRIAEVTGTSQDEVLAALRTVGLDSEYSVPGPGLEGFLFPDTYNFASGVPVEDIVEAMVTRYLGRVSCAPALRGHRLRRG